MSAIPDVTYTIRIVDSENGNVISVLEQFKFLQISRQVNKPGYYQLVFDGLRTPDIVDLTGLDYRLEFWRSGRLIGSPIREYTAMNRTYVRAQFRSGIVQHSMFGRGLEDLLQRRIIASYADVVADLSGPIVCGGVYNAEVDLIMWACAVLHAGVEATTANGRLANGVTPGLVMTVPGVSAGGSVWEGDTAYRNLLEVLQELSDWSWENGTGFDFSVEPVGYSGAEFFVHTDGLGLDRTLGNGVNKEVLFTAEQGNLKDIWFSRARSEEINRIYALGDGDGNLRDIEVVQDNATIPVGFGGTGADSSSWNMIEAARSAPSNTAGAQLRSFGEKEVAKNSAPATAVFVPRNQLGAVYGVDYELGDTVTVIHEGERVDIRITGVEIFVTADGEENIQLTTEVARDRILPSYFSFDDSSAADFIRNTADKSETELNRKAIAELKNRLDTQLTR